jgi:hypothetical protein
LLLASLDQAATIDGALITAVIADLGADEAPLSLKNAAALEHDPLALDLAARVAMLETHVEEQGAALRRVLGVLVDWVEADVAPAPTGKRQQRPAA